MSQNKIEFRAMPDNVQELFLFLCSAITTQSAWRLLDYLLSKKYFTSFTISLSLTQAKFMS